MRKILKWFIIGAVILAALDRFASILLYWVDPEFKNLVDGKRKFSEKFARTREDVSAVLNFNGEEPRRIEHEPA